MLKSIWRYSHLTLAVSFCLFIGIAAGTGIILSFDAAKENATSFKSKDFNQLQLIDVLPVISNAYTEISEVTVDATGNVIVEGINDKGKSETSIIDPVTGKILGKPVKKSDFIESVTSLHRSLFLHETGRLIMGFTAFILLLISVTGLALVIQRQQGIKRIFSKVTKDNNSQYYHTVTGRLALVIIVVISLTGTHMLLNRLGLFKTQKIVHKIDFDNIDTKKKASLKEFPGIKNVKLAEVTSIVYPFADDPEEYYLVKLQDKELAINQFSGEILSEVHYTTAATLAAETLNIHTGRTNLIWAIILGLASLNILYFIYSGFAITLKRRKYKIKNKHKAHDSRFVILVGSQGGSTWQFAQLVHNHLVKHNHTSFITDLNNYQQFKTAEHLLILTATYGDGEAPANAHKFLKSLEGISHEKPVGFAVAGFGSRNYTDFCKYAIDVYAALGSKNNMNEVLPLSTIHDRSPEEFYKWISTWLQEVSIPAVELPATLTQIPEKLNALEVIEKGELSHTGGSFILKLKPKGSLSYTSGDCLAVYPASDYRERLYSIGKVSGNIQLSVKLHENGLGSSFLYGLKPGDSISARIVKNTGFNFPHKAPAVIMISNGTGIAPFIGMIDQNTKRKECYLYSGFRHESSVSGFEKLLNRHLSSGQLSQLRIALSRSDKKQYVTDVLAADKNLIGNLLSENAVIMICGSLAMMNDVSVLLEEICISQTGRNLEYYKSKGQIMTDCY